MHQQKERKREREKKSQRKREKFSQSNIFTSNSEKCTQNAFMLIENFMCTFIGSSGVGMQ